MGITYRDLREILEEYDNRKGIGRRLKRQDQEDIAKLRLLVRRPDQRLSPEDFATLISILQNNKTRAGGSSRHVMDALKSKIEGWNCFSLDINRSPYFNIVNPYKIYYPPYYDRDVIARHRFPVDVAHILNTLYSQGALTPQLEFLIVNNNNVNVIIKMLEILTTTDSYYLFELLKAENGFKVLKTLCEADLLKAAIIKKIIIDENTVDKKKRRIPINYLKFHADLALLAYAGLTEEKFNNVLAFHGRTPQPNDAICNVLAKYKIYNNSNLTAVYSVDSDRIAILSSVLKALQTCNINIGRINIQEILQLTLYWNVLPVNVVLRAWGREVYESGLQASEIITGLVTCVERLRPIVNPSQFINQLFRQPFEARLWGEFRDLFINNPERARLVGTLLNIFGHLHPNINELFRVGLALDPAQAIPLLRQLPLQADHNPATWNNIVRVCAGQGDATRAFQQWMAVTLGRVNPRRVQVNYAQSIHNKFVEQSAAESAIRLYQRYQEQLVNRDKYREEILEWAAMLGKNDKEVAAKKAITRITNPAYAYTNKMSQISTDTLIILTWIAIHDTEMRGFGMNPDDAYRKSVFTLNAAKEALIDAYYQIQRGYNLDDKGNEIQEAVDDDSPICTGGTFIKILEKLVGLHPDVIIKFMTKESASEQLLGVARVAAMDYLRSLPEAEYQKTVAQLRGSSADGTVGIFWQKIHSAVKETLKAYAELYAGEKDAEAKFDAFIATGQFAPISDEDLKKIEVDRSKKIPANDIEGLRASRVRMFGKGKQHASNEAVSESKNTSSRK